MDTMTAAVNRTRLLEALTEAEKAFGEAKAARYEDMIAHLMKEKAGWFTSRTRTRDEAEARYKRAGWDATAFEGYWDFYHANNDLERAREIRKAAESESVYDIRLTENDLRLLRPFL